MSRPKSSPTSPYASLVCVSLGYYPKDCREGESVVRRRLCPLSGLSLRRCLKDWPLRRQIHFSWANTPRSSPPAGIPGRKYRICFSVHCALPGQPRLTSQLRGRSRADRGGEGSIVRALLRGFSMYRVRLIDRRSPLGPGRLSPSPTRYPAQGWVAVMPVVCSSSRELSVYMRPGEYYYASTVQGNSLGSEHPLACGNGSALSQRGCRQDAPSRCSGWR